MQPAEGILIADRFLLVRALGRGGMGSVWLARHMSLDIPCAVKFLHAEAAASADLRARFEREAKAAAQLRSPHVVQILDHGVWQDLPYIAMELLEGEDLDHRLRRARTLGPHQTAAIIGQIARALTRAHAAGLVHRDLKPGNVFLVRDDDREVTKVLDFGIAKRTQLEVGDASTQTGSLLGTPFFMSPEQARGARDVDHRTDLWALGVITYRCLVGELPFRGAALGDLFMKIIVEPLPVPSQQGPGLPPGFDAWWERAMQRDPGQRFQSAKEMTDALTMALGISTGPTDPSGSFAAVPRAPLPSIDLPGPSTPLPTSSNANVASIPSTVTAVMSISKPMAASRSGVIVAAALGFLVLGAGAAVAWWATAATPSAIQMNASTSSPPAVGVAPAPPSADAAPVILTTASASPAPLVSAAPPGPPLRASPTSAATALPLIKPLASPAVKSLKPSRHDDGI